MFFDFRKLFNNNGYLSRFLNRLLMGFWYCKINLSTSRPDGDKNYHWWSIYKW